MFFARKSKALKINAFIGVGEASEASEARKKTFFSASIQQGNELLFHFFVNIAITGKGFRALNVA